MNTEDLKVEVCDIETYKALFLYNGYDVQTGEKFQFEVSFRKNEIDGLVKHLLEYPRWGLCTFNGVYFDTQVLQFIVDHYEKWTHFTWRQVVDEIFYFAQQTIDDRNYELPPKYKEQYLSFKQIDLFLLLHYNGDAKRTSLKWTEFSLDGDIEELPIDFRKEELLSEEIDDVISYCWNDVMATYNLYKVCIGDTEHPDYKGKNKVQLRLDLIDEYELSHVALNWNDVKIGTELNKKSYLQLSKINEAQLYSKVKERKTKTGFYFKDCFPEYMKFQTKEFQDFFKTVGNIKVNLNEKQEFPFTKNGTTFMFAKGGCHSQDKPKKINIPQGYILISADVSSMYPNIIRKRNIYPSHLGPKWNEAYVLNISKRLEAKKLYKQTGEKKYDNFQETYKLILNGSFGKLGDTYDWQYDAFAGMQVTIGGQIDLFMLIERFCIAGFQITS
ncbi:MAG: Klebsiella phage vB KpnM KpV79, partial [Bacteroidota bacterium]